MGYYYQGQRFCMRTFVFLHCLQRNRFHSLVKHYRKNGLSLRVHGNKNWLPSSTSSAETVKQVVKFILNTAEEQALILQGRVPGFKRIDVKLLPSNRTKHGLGRTYTEICVGTGTPSVGYSKFCDLWNQLCPFIVIMRPSTDLCWTCQKNNNRISCIRRKELLQELLSRIKRWNSGIFESCWFYSRTRALFIYWNSSLFIRLCTAASFSCRPKLTWPNLF